MDKNTLKRFFAAVLALALAFSLSACGAGSQGSGGSTVVRPAQDLREAEEMREAFDEFQLRVFTEYIESDYTAAHIYFKDLENNAYGIDPDSIEVSFGGGFTEEEMRESEDYYRDLGEELKGFDRDLLTARQQDIYDAMEDEIGYSLAMSEERFDYYAQLLSPVSGLTKNIPSLFTGWDLRNERDAEDVITLLGDLPRYFDEAEGYISEQQERQLLITDFDAIITDCSDIIEKGGDSSVLRALIEQLPDLGLTDEQIADYTARITEAYTGPYISAFEDLKAFIEEIRNGFNSTGSYADFPDGTEYYELILWSSSGSDMGAEAMYDYMEGRSDLKTDLLYKTIYSDSTLLDEYLDESNDDTGFADYNEILNFIFSKMYEDYDEVRDLEYNVEIASPEEKLSERNVLAYFLIPPVDAGHLQQMRVSPDAQDVQTLTAFGTIAHEGFPGHMYQYAYIYDNCDSPYIMTLGSDGFVEGYAMYAEYNAFDYLEDRFKRGYLDLHVVDSQMSYIDSLLTDIGVNYYGWTAEDVLDFFTEMGYDLPTETAQEMYDDFRYDPAAYAPYAFGYEYIAEMRENAEEELGSRFSSKAFNRALLEAGPVPLDIVKRHTEQYIDDPASYE